jgi:hypothetical protein
VAERRRTAAAAQRKREIIKPGNRPPGGIAPIPVVGPKNARIQQRIEDVEDPFKVDRDDPDIQKLASLIGWGRLYEIEREEHDAWEEAKQL